MSNERKTILHTIHGSHLYNLAHENSDKDSYAIFIGTHEMDSHSLKKFARQTLDNEGNDILRMHLSRFLQNIHAGSPQALEALFSPYAEFDPLYEPFFKGMRTSMNLARITYRRTITNFAYSHGGRSEARAQRDNDYDRFKLARHALRLTLNLNDLMKHGYFNPHLSDDNALMITEIARSHGTEYYENQLENMLGLAQLGRL